ncbi:hypothetical protein AAES_158645 [Amazona aestiva]|uniref:C2 domain-containing protein n=1 Tax=Amazona aestiva TaxID=12930 RepID=A0A0Q3UQ65_AMAAE|nr:hypothetical protein AAES_158645 [Amazona aestiva]
MTLRPPCSLHWLSRPEGAFAMDHGHVSSHRLSVTASPPRWEIGIYAAGAVVLLGVAALNLWKLWRSGTYPAPSPFPNYDYRYLEQKYGGAHPDTKHKAVDTVGEILLSLSYLPTAERLTVVVVKAKNLVWTNGKVTADPFVKVYLLQDGRKISKKKTAVKRDDTNPVFNEAMIFSVPAIVLQPDP